MACKDCLNNCDIIVSDQCVLYTGPEIPLLGVCPGDQLSKFEAAVVSELTGILTGTGINPTGVTVDCDFLTGILGVASPSLSNLLQMLIDASCTLKELVDAINAQISSNPVFNTLCLTGLPTNPTRDDILQATVNLVCSIKTTVDAIPATYVKNSDLTNLVTQIVNQINGGGGTVVQNNTRMVPYTVVAYFGPLSNFDSGGSGRSELGYDKLYICNGSNGTPDLRGRVIVGAIQGVAGGALDAAVDPAANPNNPAWAVNEKHGETFHSLTGSETPVHTHTITDPGHSHSLTFTNAVHSKDQGSTQVLSLGSNSISPVTISDRTGTSQTGITIGSFGGGQPHNNIQPSMAGCYIMYIP